MVLNEVVFDFKDTKRKHITYHNLIRTLTGDQKKRKEKKERREM